MNRSASPAPQPSHSYRRLSLINLFFCWKILLVGLALLVPSPVYDTSTSLLLRNLPSEKDEYSPITTWLLPRLCMRLTSWDALYFSRATFRGYVNEQDWAFGWGYTRAVATLQQALFSAQDLTTAIFSGLILSNISHLASVLALYELTLVAFPGSETKKMAYIAACLHIISPAGLFLSAPYSESTFAFTTFFGYYLYALSLSPTRGQFQANSLVILSGCSFFLASTVRSNGVLSGILFLIDFISELSDVRCGNPKILIPKVVRIGCSGLGGLLVGLGLVLPQFVAWKEFCKEGESREWCTKTVPSIYFFVQDYYWNVGFLRYWTLSNVPLFLLALPMLVLLMRSAAWGLTKATAHSILPRIALPQLLLAVLALFSYHVQIITRLSSGCAVWYWWVASQLLVGFDKGVERSTEKTSILSNDRVIVRWMVMYGIIQCVLYAGFLPPA